MGMNACYLYGENSIDRIDYYPNYTIPFGITNRVVGAGSVNQHSIVDAGGRHFLFDRNYGFCEYRGGIEFPFGGRPISDTIEEEIAAINPVYYDHICGVFLRQRQMIYWTVPADGATIPTKLFAFDMVTGNWVVEDFPAQIVNHWVLTTTVTWQDLIDRGYDIWTDFGTDRWGQLITETPQLVFSNDNGLIYSHETEADDGGAYESYRIEPMLDFGSPGDKDLLLEIWFGISNGVGDYEIHVWHRSGATVGECKSAGWTALNNVNCNSPDYPVTYLSDTNNFHQIKWGTDGANETYEVNSIEFKYQRQGRY